MLATAIIVFRETLEAALVVSIILAASYGAPGRNGWVAAGVGLGALGACLVAAFGQAITALAQGMGQELMNASILLLAVVMLGWHTIWMSQHGKELARDVGEVGKAVAAGSRPLTALALAAGAAVLREGSETVLFLYGVASAGDGGVMEMVSGGVIGGLLGIGAGVLLYRGLLSIPLRYLFAVTNTMILLLTSGLAAQAASFLEQADILPALGSQLWDTSWLLSEGSLAGKVLHSLIGYEARPSGIQALFYVTVLAVLASASWVVSARHAAAGKAAG